MGESLDAAQAALDAEQYNDVIRIVGESMGSSGCFIGPGLAAYLARGCGLTGMAHFRVNDKVAAVEYANKAIDVCARNEDHEGVKVWNVLLSI